MRPGRALGYRFDIVLRGRIATPFENADMPQTTASQTAGPFWHVIDAPEWADLLRADGPNAGAAGERIVLAAASPMAAAMR